jgi:hypothetical protein
MPTMTAEITLFQIAAVGVAYILSLGLGHWLVVGGLQLFLSSKSSPHPRAWGIGLIERFIYTSSIMLHLPIEVIGGWLVLKGLAQFKPKSGDNHDTDKFLDEYYSYLIGTGLSLIVGVGSGLLGRLLLGLKVVPN